MGKNKPKGNRSSTPAGRRSTGRTPSTTEEEGKKCEHVRKNVNLTKFKKKLTAKKSLSVKCEVTPCQSSQDETVWICLKCAQQGCGRYSEDKHALKHFTSAKHPLAVNLITWDIWCYTCDHAVDPEGSRELQQCVAELRRRLEPDKDRQKYHPPSPSGAVVVLPHSVKGLNNIGNTCFFNSVIQNLNQTFLLHHSLKSVGAVGRKKTVVVPDGSLEPLDVVIADRTGDVTTALCSVLESMTDSSKKGAITPRTLFNSLRAKVRRFEGYRQQDSHELLRHLLDEMKTEETVRAKRAILAHYNVSSSSKESMKSLTDKDRESIKCYGRSVNHTFVDEVFGGELVSTLVCKQCGQVSKLDEEFLDLSVPVPSEFKHHKVTPTSSTSAPNATLSKHQTKKQKEESKKQQKHDAKMSRKKGTTMTIAEFQNYDSSTGKQEVDGANEKVGVVDEKVGVVNAEVGGANEEAPRPDHPKGNKTEQEDEQEVENDGNPNQEAPIITRSDANGPAIAGPERDDDSEMQTCSEGQRREETQANEEDLSERIESMNLHQSEANAIAQPSCHRDIAMVTPTEPEDSSRGEEAEKEKEEEKEEENKAEEDEKDEKEEEEEEKEEEKEEGEEEEEEEEEKEEEEAEKKKEEKNGTEEDKKEEEEEAEEDKKEEEEEIPQPLACPSTMPCEGRLEHCLMRFTSTELLTGKDQYACDRCTKRRQQKRKAKQRNLPVNEGEETKRKTHAEVLTEGSANGGVARPSSDQSGAENGDSAGKDETVFADADKRFLIKHLPPVLTLHLKRFEQRGMRATKNNRHVAFPCLLDMAPFCTQDSKDLTDSDGRLLYSLYGVVEHHGSMAGGHYVAYVRVRPSSVMPVRAVSCEDSGKIRCGDTEGAEEEEGQASSMQHQNQQVAPFTEGQPNGVTVQGKQVEVTKEESVEPVEKKELVTTSDTEGSVENHVDQEHHKPPDGAENVENGGSQKCGASSGDEDSAEPPVTNPSSVCTPQDGGMHDEERRFDESSTAGRWYYISDSHVSAVSENKVLSSQAFLLFYEKLPLINSMSN